MSHANYQKVAGNQTFDNNAQFKGEVELLGQVQYGVEKVTGGSTGAVTALTTNIPVSVIESSTALHEYSLANGSTTGSVKYIVLDGNANESTIASSISFAAAGSGPNGKVSASLSGAGNSLSLIWTGQKWASLGFGYTSYSDNGGPGGVASGSFL